METEFITRDGMTVKPGDTVYRCDLDHLVYGQKVPTVVKGTVSPHASPYSIRVSWYSRPEHAVIDCQSCLDDIESRTKTMIARARLAASLDPATYPDKGDAR